MIAPLRRAHRIAFVALAVLLPLLLVLALVARRAAPINEPLPAELKVGGAVSE